MMNTILIPVHINHFIHKELKASITVEAAFSFTLTVFVMFMLLGPLLIIKTTSDILTDMNNASIIRCNYEMIKYETRNTSISNRISNYLKENEFLEKNIGNIENALNYGIFVANFDANYDETQAEYRNIQYVYDINRNVYDETTGLVRIDYEIKFYLPYNVLHVDGILKRLLINRRAFIGSDGDRFNNNSDNGDYIYLSNNSLSSKVYHDSLNCVYFVKSVTKCHYEDIKEKRNLDNEKYTKCSYCFKKIKIKANTECYITKYGDRFHYKDNCPMMTAYVRKVPKEYIERYNLRLCSYCARHGGGEE